MSEVNIHIGDTLDLTSRSDIPFDYAKVKDLYGLSNPINLAYNPTLIVDSLDGSVTHYYIAIGPSVKIIPQGIGGTTCVTLDEFALGTAISNGITNSGLGQISMPSTNHELGIIADKLQLLLDKDKPKEIKPVEIPKTTDKDFLLL